MTLRIALRHTTRYRYDRPVRLGPQLVRLHPASHSVTKPLRYSLQAAPRDHFLHWQQDPLGNHVARFVFPDPVDHFHLDVELVADLEPVNPFDFFLDPDCLRVPFVYPPPLLPALSPYFRLEPAGQRFMTLVQELSPSGDRTIDWLVEVNRRVEDRVEYVVRLEPGIQTPEETLDRGRGSCRDSAWLLVQLLRQMGVAARFVSGYLVQLVSDVKPLVGPAGPDTDFADLHAWAEAFVPGAGWIGLDATSGLLATEGHIPLACAPDPSMAAPVAGSLDKCEVELSHTMTVARLVETPRVTRPYEPSEWAAIDALGHQVDEALARGDVRLWYGGEPTFVSVDDLESPEWTVHALGAHKRQRAEDLFERMCTKLAPGGLRHFGQGKWYPSESLPRWALSCFFRRDGEPLWNDPDLCARPGTAPAPSEATVRRFGELLCARLGVSDEHLTAAYEDTWYYLWRERRLPINVTPHDSRLADEEERARLSRVFERGLEHKVGYALPLRAARQGAGVVWESGPLLVRQETLFLAPGDSAMGYRLPLDSLPWVAETDFPFVADLDPFADLPPWPPPSNGAGANGVHRRSGSDVPAAQSNIRVGTPARAPERFESDPSSMRTALCLEVREGTLYVFMPPVPDAPSYLELVAAVEAVASDLGVPVRLEGYPPPQDPRLGKFSVTPDPGVIEVNVAPTDSWEELVGSTRTLYALARESRLTTAKFLLDGRHVGTGGGNHVTLGGPSAADSPLLRRPDLLRSLLGYWLDHPSLSYLFSGLFIGPTSQHPRIDEARHESVRELGIAFDELDRHPGSPPPWLVDRVFRHLLVDATGNTHRAEFCIDKLYSPDGPSGRLGLLELRAFEMPPHPEMSLTQALLLRGLVAWLWSRPYSSRRPRWGASLHDRFMLPHFVIADFREVLDDLRGAGFAFRDGWFEPHIEFRFPRIGTVDCEGVAMEARAALEPWNVLGEEAVTSGMTRFVDSSLERLQVKIRGAIDERHTVLVNGAPMPLHPTGVRGEAVAGVRYRAWQPPSALHPTIRVHGPLRIEVADRARGRSMGGAVYHVAHPDGRNYERFPVNAEEAAARRRARFVPFGHTPGELAVPAPAVDPDGPFTLDLRKRQPRARQRPPLDRMEPETIDKRRVRFSS